MSNPQPTAAGRPHGIISASSIPIMTCLARMASTARDLGAPAALLYEWSRRGWVRVVRADHSGASIASVYEVTDEGHRVLARSIAYHERRRAMR